MRISTSPRVAARSRHRVALLAATVVVGGGLMSASAAEPATTSSTFVPIAPCRLLDTRPAPDNVGTRATPVGDGESFTTQVTGINGNCTIPAGAVGISTNVAIVNPTAASFLTVHPSDVTRPLAASLNWVAGQAPTPNAVTVQLSADGKVTFFNYDGTVDLAVDVVGYYLPAAAPADVRMTDSQIAQLQWHADPAAHRSATLGAGSVTAAAGIAFDGDDQIWLVGEHGRVTAVDRDTLAATTTTIPGDGTLSDLVFDGTRLWTTDTTNDRLVAIDPVDGSVVRTVQLAGDVAGLAWGAGSLWTTVGTSLVPVAPSTGAIGTATTLPAAGRRVATDGTAVWVSHELAGTVSRVHATTRAVTTVSVGSHPTTLLFDGTWMWVVLYGDDRVVPLDANTGVAGTAVDLGSQPNGMAFDGSRLWVTSIFGSTTSVIDPYATELVQTYPAASGNWLAVFDGRNVWVASSDVTTTVARLLP